MKATGLENIESCDIEETKLAIASAVNERAAGLKRSKGLRSFVPKKGSIPMLWGPPGIGKTSIVAQVASELGIEFVQVVGHFWDPPSIMGFPFLADDPARPGGKVMDFSPPRIFPTAKLAERGIFFIDEIPNCVPAVQSAWATLILDRKTPVFEFPPGWTIVCAGNNHGETQAAQRMDEALAGRLTHLDVMPSMADFNLYAQATGFDSTVLAFLNSSVKWSVAGGTPDSGLDRGWLVKKKPSNAFAKGWPQPRTWEMASDVLQSDEYPDRIKLKMVAGLVGKQATEALRIYIQVRSLLPPVEDFIEGKALLSDKEFKGDVSKTALIIFDIVEWMVHNNKPANLKKALTAIQKSPQEMQAMALAVLWSKPEVKSGAMRTPEFMKIVQSMYPDITDLGMR